jgi:parallel beta-helix repeat protein
MKNSKCFLVIALLIGATPVTNAATFTVISAADAGLGTLRAAILDANGNPGFDRIEFAIPGASPFRIAVLTPLPSIMDPLVIDGDTQPGVQIDGALLDTGNGLEVLAGGSGTEIKGLEIGHFPDDGILLVNASGVTLANNVVRSNLNGIHLIGSLNNDIGVTGSGNTVIDNAEVSILLAFESHGNRVTDNDVWGLGQAAPNFVLNRGIFLLFGANDNSVTHNRVYDQGNHGIIAAINTDRNEISYNYIENSDREGIELAAEVSFPGSGETAAENIIAHNILVNNTHLDEVGDITLFAGANGNVIKDNHITGSDDGIGRGIHFIFFNSNNRILDNVVVGTRVGFEVLPTNPPLLGGGFDPGSNENVIKGNEFRDNILDGININPVDLFSAGTSSDNIISENSVINSGRHGIHIGNPDGLGNVTNNRIDENTIKKITGDGMIIGADVNGNRVSENTFQRIDGNGVTILGDGNRVDENNFRGVSGLDIDDQGIGNITE